VIRDEKDRKFWKFWNNRDDAKSVHLGSCVAQPIEYKHANDRAGLGHGILSTRRLQNWIFRITYTHALKLTTTWLYCHAARLWTKKPRAALNAWLLKTVQPEKQYRWLAASLINVRMTIDPRKLRNTYSLSLFLEARSLSEVPLRMHSLSEVPLRMQLMEHFFILVINYVLQWIAIVKNEPIISLIPARTHNFLKSTEYFFS